MITDCDPEEQRRLRTGSAWAIAKRPPKPSVRPTPYIDRLFATQDEAQHVLDDMLAWYSPATAARWRTLLLVVPTLHGATIKPPPGKRGRRPRVATDQPGRFGADGR